ncbi:unnamed protein product [Schistocephalus solidus]|uniref:MATH domain-containing protein n=1 Tax=Schistocephalus solidus TaxID=70667 RepID=A0A183TL40_SCHSO|nr:unnamed protein product [Schistocephalus solidus]
MLKSRYPDETEISIFGHFRKFTNACAFWRQCLNSRLIKNTCGWSYALFYLRFADIVSGSVSPYTDASSEKFSRIMRLDCRGLQPLAFSPRVGWRVTSSASSRVFDDVDLGQSDWTDYDDDGDQCVGVFDVTSRFVSSK